MDPEYFFLSGPCGLVPDICVKNDIAWLVKCLNIIYLLNTVKKYWIFQYHVISNRGRQLFSEKDIMKLLFEIPR